MIPKLNQHVKCIFNTGIIVEGIVIKWEDKNIELKSLNDNSILLILRPEEIVFIKIMLNEQLDTSKIILEKELESILKKDHNPYDIDRNKRLVDLRVDLIKQERKIISEKLKDHAPTNITKVKYEYPSFNKK